MGVQQTILEARSVSKAFFGNPVLRGVAIERVAGRIHALLGENGAGKSTLINLLSGTLRPDGGQILVDGRPIASLTPQEAHQLGIAVVQQELSLAPHLSIAENIGLGAYPRRGGVVDHGSLALAVPDVGTDRAILMKLVRRLRDRGVAILYISHRLNEILDFCDYVTVLKDGSVTADRQLAGLDPDGLIRLMVGRDPRNLFPPYVSRASGDLALETTRFRARGG